MPKTTIIVIVLGAFLASAFVMVLYYHYNIKWAYRAIFTVSGFVLILTSYLLYMAKYSGHNTLNEHWLFLIILWPAILVSVIMNLACWIILFVKNSS